MSDHHDPGPMPESASGLTVDERTQLERCLDVAATTFTASKSPQTEALAQAVTAAFAALGDRFSALAEDLEERPDWTYGKGVAAGYRRAAAFTTGER